MMKDEELKNILLQVKGPAIDSQRKEAAVCFVMSSKKERRGLTRITYWERLRSMVGYLSGGYWIIQGFLLLLCGYCAAAGGEKILVLATTAPLLGCIGCTEIQRGYACGMWELEMSCRYDLRQVMLLKMQIFGGVDLAAILCLMIFAGSTGAAFPQMLVTILLPYLLSCSVYFLLLCVTDRKVSNYVMIGVGVFMAVATQMVFSFLDDVSWNVINTHAEWAALAVLAAADLLLLAMRWFWKTCDMEGKKAWSFD